jgi:purine-nucleoside phosphorylase
MYGNFFSKNRYLQLKATTHMSIHISAKKGELAPVVLMPGDPLRAKHIAENMLDDARLVSQTRNIFFYTGSYEGTRLTIGSSGMGCPSIGIYSWELYNEFDVKCIIRVGTCGSYLKGINLYDIINVDTAYSESTYALTAFGIREEHIPHQGKAYEIINDTAKQLNIPVRTGPVHSGDAFYRTETGLPPIAIQNNCLAAEMEAFALFANAKVCNKMAATILTVSDNIITKEIISPDERERSLDVMAKLALTSAIKI